ncbi:MAG TPA: SAM-dependent methyltransferase, partial [Usitatibacter sp.]
MPSPAESALPPPTPDASAHSQQLAEHIANTIVAEGEWIPFSRYMELALYAPGLGYYAAGARKFGSEGDFVTSPEISPMFAKCLALQAAQVLKDVGGDILELGPGSGVFAADLWEALKEMGSLPRRYLLLEVSPDLRERQRALLAQRFPAEMDRFEWIDRLPGKIRGLVIANEVLDVVPCSMVHRDSRGSYFEQGVILTEAGFAFEDQPLQDGELKRRAATAFPPGDYDYIAEINFAAEALVRTIAGSLEAGV